MGQYYRAITQQNGTTTVYNRNIKRGNKEEYTFAKLTEHSWWLNDFVNAVCSDIYQETKPVRIAWVGDYADDVESQNDLDGEQIKKLHKLAWDCKGIAVEPTKFTLKNKYLVNHSNYEYLDCNKYFKNSITAGWCLHPLPLLTCIGNGLGGGDYCSPTGDSTAELVGFWAWDEISITDEPPQDYEELTVIFKEKGWEE